MSSGLGIARGATTGPLGPQLLSLTLRGERRCDPRKVGIRSAASRAARPVAPSRRTTWAHQFERKLALQLRELPSTPCLTQGMPRRRRLSDQAAKHNRRRIHVRRDRNLDHYRSRAIAQLAQSPSVETKPLKASEPRPATRRHQGEPRTVRGTIIEVDHPRDCPQVSARESRVAQPKKGTATFSEASDAEKVAVPFFARAYRSLGSSR